MKMKKLRAMAARFVEVIAVLGLVLIFFSAFVGLLNLSFPSGLSLKKMIGRHGIFSSRSRKEQSPREFLLTSPGEESALENLEPLVATLTRARRKVKSKRAEDIAWTSANEGMSLFNRDAIQTLKRSGATIRFDENNHLSLGNNSLVIIKRLEQNRLLREKRSTMLVVDGELSGSLSNSEGSTMLVELVTPNAVARIAPGQGPDGRTDFKVMVNPDESSTLIVYKGSAEISAQGKTIRVEANHAATVKPDEAPMAPIQLPGRPVPIAPSENHRFRFRELYPPIEFKWKTPEDVRNYRIVLAKDSDFSDVVYDSTLENASFTHGNLKEGGYFWRVSAIKGRLEGDFSDIRRITLVRDLEPPRLDVQFPPKTVKESQYLLRGKTESNTQVFVGGEPVSTTKAGAFQHLLQLRPGINMIVVEAVDPVGNVSYESQLVNRKF